jgi:outer membrane protein assembly factor BamB
MEGETVGNETTMAPRFCADCGARRDPAARFCPDCGARFGEPATVTGDLASPEDDLSALPPPSSHPRRRRWPIVAAATVVVAGLGVTLWLLAGGDEGGADGGRFPDLTSPPQVRWSVETEPMFDELLADWGTWEDGSLAEAGWIEAFDAGGTLVVRPSLYESSGPLYGIDRASGQQRWEERVAEGAALSCVTTGSHLTCLESTYRDRGEQGYWSNVLHQVTGAGGRQLSTDVVDSDELPALHAEADMVVLTATDAGRVTVAAYAADGHRQRWSSDLRGDAWRGITTDERGIVVTTTWAGGEELHALIDPRDGVTTDLVGADRDGWETAYEWVGDGLYRSEVPGYDQGGAARIHRLEPDGTERWSVPADGRLVTPGLHEAGAPLLNRSSDGDVISALDPADGAERWRYRSEEDHASVGFATAREVGVRDGDRLVVLDARTGEERWSSRHLDGYTTVRLGQRGVYSVDVEGTVQARSLADGELLWSWEHEGRGSEGYTELVDVGGTVVVARGDRVTALG